MNEREQYRRDLYDELADALGSDCMDSHEGRLNRARRANAALAQRPQQAEPVACPFCGFVPDFTDDDCIHPVNNERTVWALNCYETGGGCGASILGSSEQDCIDRWKKRAAPPADDEAVRLLKRARWFVKQENDACIVACAEDPDYCCADTLTAIDAYLAKVGDNVGVQPLP